MHFINKTSISIRRNLLDKFFNAFDKLLKKTAFYYEFFNFISTILFMIQLLLI